MCGSGLADVVADVVAPVVVGWRSRLLGDVAVVKGVGVAAVVVVSSRAVLLVVVAIGRRGVAFGLVVRQVVVVASFSLRARSSLWVAG